LTWLSYLQNPLGRALGGHFANNMGRFLRLDGSLAQAALKVYNTRFQFFHAPTLTVHRLEKAVECLPDIFLTHDPYPSSFTGGFNLLFHT
jgi:hypothetical protein